MIRILVRLSLLVLVATGIAWLADRPGLVQVQWMGLQIETSLAAAAAFLAISFLIAHLLLRALRVMLKAPGEAAGFFRGRRHRRGFDALSRGFLAIGAGDLALARRHAEAARRILPDEPLTRLLEVQTAQAAGDTGRVAGLLTDMTADARTALLGLRGLHTQAQASGNAEAARSYAEQALKANPQLGWASRAVMAARTAAGDWDGVLRLIESQRRAGLLSQTDANAKKAVVLTAEADALGTRDPKAAFGLAFNALKLAPDLVPAAITLCRLAAQTGQWRKAEKQAARAFALSPHAGLAEAYARLQPSASPADRVKRLRQLVTPESGEEGAVALARAALSAREFAAARETLAPFMEGPRARVATLLAAIAEGEGDHGKAREWLSRALTAPRDPQWTADGYVSESWLPASPVSGELGAFQWKVPVERIGADPQSAFAPPPAPEPRPAPAEPALAHLPDDPGIPEAEDEPAATTLARAEKLAGSS